MHLLLRIVGWLVAVGGSLTSVVVFWIDPMRPILWMAMGISVATSLAVGSATLWTANRWTKRPSSELQGGDGPSPADDHVR